VTEDQSDGLRVWAGLWSALFCLSLIIVISRFSTTVDLGYFLPAPETLEQEVLTSRLGQGAGSQLWFLELPAGFSTQPYTAAEQYAELLRATGLFRSVATGASDISPEALPGVVFANRYLLADADFSAAGVSSAVADAIPDIMLAPDAAMESLLLRDPYYAALNVLERVGGNLGRVDVQWVTEDGAAYVLAESLAPAYEADAQQGVAAVVEQSALELFGVAPRAYGVGAYSSGLQETVRAEAQVRSLLATVAIVLVLLFMYRRVRLVFVSLLPLALGAVAALAVLTLVFDQVHGITLAFGFTLFGVAIDFPLHAFSHSRGGRRTLNSIWPTLRLGATSTVLAYIAVSASGSQGLAQLGIFSATGVLVSFLATRTLLPYLIAAEPETREPETRESGTTETAGISHRVWLPCFLIAFAFVSYNYQDLWSDDLSALTPLPAETLKADRELRQNFGAPDIRYLILQQGEELQVLLEQVNGLSNSLREGALVSSVQAVTDLLPPESLQRKRMQALQVFDPDYARQAAVEHGLVKDALDAFASDTIELQGSDDLLSADSYSGTKLESVIASQLYQQDGVWYSVMMPGQVGDVAKLQQALPDSALLIDLKNASVSLVRNYRVSVLTMLLIALVAVTLLLLAVIRSGRRVLWIVGGLLATVCGTLGLSVLVFGSLSLFNLVALVLVAGLGLDYLLFMSRDAHDGATGHVDSKHAITASMLSTAAAFGILAVSAIPVLSGLGVTVFFGVLLAYLIASAGQAEKKPKP